MSFGLSLWLDIFFDHLQKKGLSRRDALVVMSKLCAHHPVNIAQILEVYIGDSKGFLDEVEHEFCLQQFVDGEEVYQTRKREAKAQT